MAFRDRQIFKDKWYRNTILIRDGVFLGMYLYHLLQKVIITYKG